MTMTVGELLRSIKDNLQDGRINLETEVVYSTDSEGNNYHKVHYHTSVGRYNSHGYEFIDVSDETLKDTDDEHLLQYPLVLCIN